MGPAKIPMGVNKIEIYVSTDVEANPCLQAGSREPWAEERSCLHRAFTLKIGKSWTDGAVAQLGERLVRNVEVTQKFPSILLLDSLA